MCLLVLQISYVSPNENQLHNPTYKLAKYIAEVPIIPQSHTEIHVKNPYQSIYKVKHLKFTENEIIYSGVQLRNCPINYYFLRNYEFYRQFGGVAMAFPVPPGVVISSWRTLNIGHYNLLLLSQGYTNSVYISNSQHNSR